MFPLETRALCIAFFYAIGTAVGGISGPLLFGKLIDSASESKDITVLAIGYFIGAALMVAGGIVAAFLGVKAEGQSLESIAQPLTAEDARRAAGPTVASASRRRHPPDHLPVTTRGPAGRRGPRLTSARQTISGCRRNHSMVRCRPVLEGDLRLPAERARGPA